MVLPPEVAFVVMVGLPGSGKTTLAREIRDKLLETAGSQCVVMSVDEFVPLRHQTGGLKMTRSAVRQVIESCLDPNAPSSAENSELTLLVEHWLTCSINFKAPGRKFVVIDDNNFLRSMRYEYFQLARQFGCGFAQIFATCDLDDALIRDSLRKERVGEHVIRKMAAKMEKPKNSDWEVASFMLLQLGHDLNIDEILQLCSSPVPPLKDDSAERGESRRICLENFAHQMDKALRKCTSEVLKRLPPGVNRGEASKLLSKCKKLLIHRVKCPDQFDLREEVVFDLLKQELLSDVCVLNPVAMAIYECLE